MMVLQVDFVPSAAPADNVFRVPEDTNVQVFRYVSGDLTVIYEAPAGHGDPPYVIALDLFTARRPVRVHAPHVSPSIYEIKSVNLRAERFC